MTERVRNDDFYWGGNPHPMQPCGGRDQLVCDGSNPPPDPAPFRLGSPAARVANMNRHYASAQDASLSMISRFYEMNNVLDERANYMEAGGNVADLPPGLRDTAMLNRQRLSLATSALTAERLTLSQNPNDALVRGEAMNRASRILERLPPSEQAVVINYLGFRNMQEYNAERLRLNFPEPSVPGPRPS